MNNQRPTHSPLDLSGLRVFLSASFPTGDRASNFPPADRDDVADAIVAVARSVLANGGSLIFGGHPTVSPLVLMCGLELRGHINNGAESVQIYQSRVFESRITDATHGIVETGIGTIVWTPRVARETPEDCPRSLRLMRERMLAAGPFCGFFIGGMEGIREEWDLARSRIPGFVTIPLSSTGGAAAGLPEPDGWPDALTGSLRSSRSYPVLVHQALVQSLRTS